jgi:serine/threonine-protein kinase RIO1
MEKTELHLFIIWSNARHKEEAILNDISLNLDIIEVLEIEWNKESYSKNLTRFYGQKLPPRSSKEKHCGNGKFLLITVLDNCKPIYDFVETSRGTEYVNLKIFNLKQKYRDWTGGGHKIHSTNSPSEMNHDTTLLLGIHIEDYLKKCPKTKWNNEIKSIKKELVGHNGWKNIKEFFYVLNSTTRYIVLRNYECLPDIFTLEEHGDIDLLVEDFEEMLLKANAEKVFADKNRVHCFTYINGKKVFFDFRYLGDNYYCRQWEKNLLKNRVLEKNSFFIPDHENYFYTLIYHCLIHKKEIQRGYYGKLEHLFKRLGLDENYHLYDYINPFDLYFDLLNKFMSQNNYCFIKPKDISVYYDEKYLNTEDAVDYLENNFKITNIKHSNINKNRHGSGYIHFVGYSRDNKKLFIKWGGLCDSAKREFGTLSVLHKHNPRNFPKPYYYKNHNDFKFIAMEYIEGVSLDILIKNQMLTEEVKMKIIKQLQDIANMLLNTGIIHRDLKPNNLIVSRNNRLFLIDTQFCIDKNLEKFPELSVIKNNPRKFRYVGTKSFITSEGKWDDMWSILKTIDLIDPKAKDKYTDIYEDIESKKGIMEYDLRSTYTYKAQYAFRFIKKTQCKLKAFSNVVRYKLFMHKKQHVPQRLKPIYELAQGRNYSLYELYRYEYKRLKNITS